MYIYILIFFSSSILLWMAETQKMSLITKNIIICIALFIPMILAGMRKIGVGTDTNVYVNLMYDAAIHSENIIDYFNYKVFSVYHFVKINTWEPGFTCLVYIVAKLFGSYQVVLFVVESIIIICIYKGLRLFRSNLPVWFGMLTFYFLFYNQTFNTMRQWVAMAILFYGFKYLVNWDIKKYLCIILVSISFHLSALIGLIIMVLFKYSVSQKTSLLLSNQKIDRAIFKIYIILVSGIIVLLCINSVGLLISKLGPAFARYVKVYLHDEVSFMPMQVMRRLPLLVLFIGSWKKIHRSSDISIFLGISIILDILISQLGSIMSQSGRIGTYFSEYNIVLYPYLLRVHRKNKFFYGILLILILFITWIYDYVLTERGQTVPYIFYFE